MRSTLVKFLKREFKQHKFVKTKSMDSKKLIEELKEAIKRIDCNRKQTYYMVMRYSTKC